MQQRNRNNRRNKDDGNLSKHKICRHKKADRRSGISFLILKDQTVQGRS